GETAYAYPSVHARFHRASGAASIGADGTGRDTHDYFQHIRLAKYGLYRDEENIGLAHSLRPQDYLRLATIEGARALGLESQLGSITPDKQADLVLLRTNRTFFPQVGDLASRVFGYSSIEDVDSVWVCGERVK
ncbi:MAG: amidohydrolase, partial [Mesorhizobium sp.]